MGHYWTPASKQVSMQREKKDETAPITVVYRNTSTSYFTTLQIRNAIQNKRCGKLSKKNFLFHDNAHSHMVDLTQWLLQDLKLEVFGNPLHSPDQTPFNFHLFHSSKNILVVVILNRGTNFNSS